MTSPPHPITNGDTADDLFARFGTLGVGGVNHSYTPHPSSVPSPKSGHTHFHMHSPAQQTTPYTPYADDELSYWTSGDQPNLGTPCTPSSSGNNGSHYPHGGPPPDLTPPSVLPDGDFPSLGEAYGTQQQHSATANNQAQQHRQGGRNRFDEYPAERSHASNNMVYSPPQQQQRPHHQQPHSYQNMNPGAGFDHYYAPHGGRQGYWMGPPHGMYMAGETNNDLQIQSLQSSPLHGPMDRLPHSPQLMTYPAHSDYTLSPTHATFGFSTPLNTSYQLSHHAMLQQLGMHSYSHIYGLQTPYSPNNRPLVVANRPYRAVPEHVPKSALLEDFRLNKVRKKWELEDVNGYIVEFCGDQHGSRFIQHRIETCTTDERQKVFDEIMPNAYQLMTDVFGNYVIQKLFEHGNQRQKAALAKKMENHVLPLSMQMYGCRVVQKALEHVLLPQREILIRELEPHILNCVKSSNANHVIQRLISLEPPESVIDAFEGHIEEIATHPYGCRVLQKAFENLDIDTKRVLLDEFHLSTRKIMEDQFGNYVVQSVIAHGPDANRSKVIEELKGRVISMSRHKFASNVCEKAIIYAEAEDRRQLIAELIGNKPDGSNNVGMLLCDQYGNFPIQTALVHAGPIQKAELLEIVRPLINGIRNTPVGKRLIDRIAKMDDPLHVAQLFAQNQNPRQASISFGARFTELTDSTTGVTSPDRRLSQMGPRPDPSVQSAAGASGRPERA